MSLLHYILNHLQQQNDAEGTISPDDYNHFIIPENMMSDSKNRLLIQQDRGEVLIGVQLDPETRKKLAQDPSQLPPSEIFTQPMAVVTEELSHLLYSCFHLGQNAQLSQLELEVQGEIDRFMALLSLGQLHGLTSPLQTVLEFLFSSEQYQDDVLSQPALHARYKEARRLSQHACLMLASYISKEHPGTRKLTSSIFRLRGHEKFQFLENLKAA